MKYLKLYSFFVLACFCFYNCSNSSPESPSIVQASDIDFIFTKEANTSSNKLSQSIQFWEQKLAKQPNASPYLLKLATLLSERFKQTGNIKDLHRSDKLLHQALDTYLLKKAGVYHALAANAITKHDFKSALTFAQKALETEERPDISKLYLFDTQLELGDLAAAKKNLEAYPLKHSFEYLIRKSKLQDVEGDLDAAIFSMEKAFSGLDAQNDTDLYVWALSNLGDMYGHAGKIKKSYESFLQVLQLRPSHHHSMKGIAWIAFSKDKNTDIAKRIMTQIGLENQLPDHHLFLAEIAAFERDERAEAYHTEAFLAKAERPQYQGMYNKYIFDIAIDQPVNLPKARAIAWEEVNKRPSVQSYQLLARSYVKSGDIQLALELSQEKIEGKSFEPEVIYHLGTLYHSAAEPDKAFRYLQEASEAGFELGPMLHKTIKEKLSAITQQG